MEGPGSPISDIARVLQKPPGSIHGMLEATGGFSPTHTERCRRRDALAPAEREEISRGLAIPENLFVRSLVGWVGLPPPSAGR